VRNLLQAVHGVHHSLKFRAVNQIEGALFSRKHFERHPSRSRNHPSSFFRSEVAARNGFDGQMYEDAQPANAPAFFVNFFLCRAKRSAVFHYGPVDAAAFSMDFGPKARNSTCGGIAMAEHHAGERVVVAHTAGTAAEAMVIRGLLESAGIRSPGSVSTDPFPLREPPEGTHGVEIFVLESQADHARRIIEEYLKGNSPHHPHHPHRAET
jgi:hypothetical protein